MRTTIFSLLFLAACGGASSEPPAAPSTTSEASKPAEKAAEPTAVAPTLPKTDTKPADPPSTAPTTPAPASDVTGQWCGKQVTDIASCKGDEVGFLDLKATGDAVTGEFCEAPKKDCMPLEASTFKSGTLSMSYKFKGGSGSGSFQLGPDGTLSGDLKATKGKKDSKVTKKFYRVK